MAYSQTRRFHKDFHVVLNTAEDILRWMEFDVRYRNPSTGRLLCHSESASTGATGYLEITVTEGKGIVQVRAEADSYNLWSNSRFLNILGWFIHHMETQLGEGTGPPDQPMVNYGDRTQGAFRADPHLEERRDVQTFEPPSRTVLMLLALVPVMIMSVMASIQVESSDDLMVVIGMMAPFILGSVLIGAGLFRAGGTLFIIFSIFAGLVFGLLVWLLVFGFGQYTGRQAMTTGRWWTYHRLMLEETKET